MLISTADPVDRVRKLTGRALPAGSPHTRALQGDWLGHPLHPVLTDMPIGFWTSSWILDLVVGKEGRRVSQFLVGAGVVSVLPTALAGWADWSRRSRDDQQLGLVHAGAVVAATSIYAASWLARRRGEHRVGVLLGHLGAGVATLGGYLGGRLAFNPPSVHASGANRPLHQKETAMDEPRDHTEEPAAPDGTDDDTERTVESGTPSAPSPLDKGHGVQSGHDAERISDPGGDSDPQPAEP